MRKTIAMALLAAFLTSASLIYLSDTAGITASSSSTKTIENIMPCQDKQVVSGKRAEFNIEDMNIDSADAWENFELRMKQIVQDTTPLENNHQ